MTTKKTAVKKAVKKEKLPKDLGVTGKETGAYSSQEYVSRESFDAHIDDYSFYRNMTEKVIYNQNQDMLTRTQYQGWLVSPDIRKRSVAVFGHALLAYIVFAGITVGILILIGA